MGKLRIEDCGLELLGSRFELSYHCSLLVDGSNSRGKRIISLPLGFSAVGAQANLVTGILFLALGPGILG